MSGRQLAHVVAACENGVIGRDGGMPWHLPDDLKRFKRITMGRVCLMGRRTFESIGRPLPGRTNLVLTRDRGWSHEGVRVAHDLDAALRLGWELAGRDASGDPARCPAVIGGGELYRLTMDLVTRIELTLIHATVDGDTVYPLPGAEGWVEVSSEHHPADERHAFAMTFRTLDRPGCVAGPLGGPLRGGLGAA